METKAGWKTTEFWVTAISAGLMLVQQGMGINLPTEQIMSIAGVVISYVLGRSIVKK